jgi:hypothetical protein
MSALAKLRQPVCTVRTRPILFSNSGAKCKLSPCKHRFHCSLRGRRPASASACQKALTAPCSITSSPARARCGTSATSSAAAARGGNAVAPRASPGRASKIWDSANGRAAFRAAMMAAQKRRARLGMSPGADANSCAVTIMTLPVTAGRACPQRRLLKYQWTVGGATHEWVVRDPEEPEPPSLRPGATWAGAVEFCLFCCLMRFFFHAIATDMTYDMTYNPLVACCTRQATFTLSRRALRQPRLWRDVQ